MSQISKGWNCRIILKGTVLKEDCGLTNTSGVCGWYLNEFPVVASNHSNTSNPTNVSVYLNKSTTTLNKSCLNLSTNGYVAIQMGNISGGNCSHDSPVQIETTYSYYRTIGYAVGVNFTQDNGVEGVYTIGSRLPVELLEGNQGMTGSISELFIDRRVLGRIRGQNVSGFMQKFNLELDLVSANVSMELRDVKVSSWGLDMSQDSIVAESTDFIAKNISVLP